MTTQYPARLIAFYLPQFHPIPENDQWWGKGFTEWTNVAKARPLFPGHYQPRIPADLGFYDLRVPETRAAQADLARSHGIEGFCYWHYWFAGKRLLERPFNEVLQSGEPDFPFCLAWANESWTGRWHGAEDRILVEQTYPGYDDDEKHFNTLLPAFSDPRYMTIEDKPILVMYAPWYIPDPRAFTDRWRELAVKAGLKGLFLIGHGRPTWDPTQDGFDAAVLVELGSIFYTMKKPGTGLLDRTIENLLGYDLHTLKRKLNSRPEVYDYADAIRYAIPELSNEYLQYPCAIPSWDNTPRSGVNGVVLDKSTPVRFRSHLRRAIDNVMGRNNDHRIVFIKSWNEWAEGNYLEPDSRFGKRYLEVIKDEIAEN